MDLFDLQINRLIKAIGGSREADLARALQIKQQSITAARKKGYIPPAWFVKISEENNVSLDWLIYGEGKKERPRSQYVREPQHHLIKSIDELPKRLREIREALGNPKPEEIDRRLSIRKGLWKALEEGSAEMTPGFPGGLQSILNVNVDWLITGHGPILLEQAEHRDRKPVPIQESRLEAFRRWIYELSNQDPAYWGWINIELLNRFPEFDDWLKKQDDDVSEDSETAVRSAS